MENEAEQTASAGGESATLAVHPRRKRPDRANAPMLNGNGAVAGDLLNAEAILAADDKLFEDVPCPEWKGVVRIRGLTGRERDDYEISLASIGPGGTVKQRLSGAREKLVAKTAIDAKGHRLFSDEQAALLGQKSGLVLDRLFDAALRMSGMRNADVELLAKNLIAAPSGDSA